LKVHIETIGCKLNQFESQALSDALVKKNFSIAEHLEDADFVIINTCSVTNKADVKSRQAMRKAKKLGKRVVVTGCYATTDFDSLLDENSADIIVKNESKFTIPELLEKRLFLEEKTPILENSSEFPIVYQFEKTRAFVKIQDGCNKFCSYCKIPHARGRSRSLEPKIAISFIKNLIAAGYKEIVLTGVNVSDYHCADTGLYELTESILKLRGDFRIRLSSLQPDEFDVRFLDLLMNEKFSPHFHLSLQSGSNGVLGRMERNYTADYFRRLCFRIRQIRPDCGITTDIIVGFPGESEIEFEETLALVKIVEFTRVHIFSYSRRSRTKASLWKDWDGKTKKERVKRLEEISLKSAKTFVEREVIGKEYRILTEINEEGKGIGYTENYLRISTKQKCGGNEFAFVTPRNTIANAGTVELEAE
jgi:threonylcarbamoyladenosine tRNA methylthiotransferase MtaB